MKMDFQGGGNGSGGSGEDRGSKGRKGLQRSDFEATMKEMKDAAVKESAEKSAQISCLMRDNVLSETWQRLENPLLKGPSVSPVRPIPCPNPFSVFPVEVWEMILENMKRLSDLEMFCLAFPQLEPLVKKMKWTTLLFEQVIPLVCKHLDLRDINNCRLVCGKWNQDLCALLANWNAPNLLPNNPSKTRIPARKVVYELRAAYQFETHGQIQKYLNIMADHPGNPILGRFLYFSVGVETQLVHFWKAMVELVEKFGEHVWHLEIGCSRAFFDLISFHQRLQETLVFVPNLRYLSVHCFAIENRSCTTEMMVAQIASSPLPPLPYLQSLLLGFTGQTGLLISAFSPYFSSQIYELKFLGETLRNVNLNDERLRGFANLEYLKVELKFKFDILRLLKFQFPSRNLKKLCLSSKYYPRPNLSVPLEHLGRVLETFSRLEHLKLTCYQVETKSSLGLRMRFPRLSILKIGIDAYEDDLQNNLDFLLWFPSLKHLIIEKIYRGISVSNPNPVDVGKMDKHSTLKIREFLLTKQFLSSNIWSLIPSLEVLELETFSRNEKYTREMFKSANKIG